MERVLVENLLNNLLNNQSIYWPWWGGALALGFIAVFFPLVLRRPLGISGLLGRLVHWKEENAAADSEEQLAEAGDLEAALMAATLARFGDEAARQNSAPSCDEPASSEAPGVRIRPAEHFLFFVAVVVGAFLAAMMHGTAELRWSLGPAFEAYFGDGLLSMGVLAGGGLMIGFGVRMGGGCTSGHGLTGCGAFQPASFLGTASFFGAGVAMAFALRGLLG